MTAAAETHPGAPRGVDLLLEHCAAIARFEQARTPALHRLQEAIGDGLARLLVSALAGDHRMPSRGLS